jgi:hypothetical protein
MQSDKVFQFDLSRSHNINDVAWPPGWKSELWVYDKDCRLQMKLPGDRTFDESLKQLGVERAGDSVDAVRAHLPNMRLDEAYAQAKRLMSAWHFDDRAFEPWLNAISKGEQDRTFQTMRNDLHPALVLKVLHSFNDEKPWFISFEAEW